ncbi:MAG: hypothetical protein DMG49_18845 [Acidobacteria bacterium]|nr:MAG: hypothetical protein DMG49_18845 [Acidobacteriota bacterium]
MQADELAIAYCRIQRKVILRPTRPAARTQAGEDDDAGRDGDSAEKRDGIDGCPVFGMEPREPLRQKVDPSGDHGEKPMRSLKARRVHS